MRKIILLAAATLIGALPALPALAQGKIGYVSTERILRDSAPAARAQKKLEAEFARREQELTKVGEQLKRLQDDLEKNGLTMPETQRRNKERDFNELNRDFQRKRRELQEDANQRKNEELATVVETANRVIRQIAEVEKYDFILQDVVFFNPRIDITDQVIKALDGKPPAK
ncbi:MAG: OmpH family outer membrane protein [Proteobacteria bacterium]|nr:OmpH family outer membrane protein [Pseudomonadota bacterium]MDA0982880.1 OmpH family outer membrane protein [Pseudomonadota bacterium]